MTDPPQTIGRKFLFLFGLTIASTASLYLLHISHDNGDVLSRPRRLLSRGKQNQKIKRNIPYNIIFTNYVNVRKHHKGSVAYNNVHNTMKKYVTAWRNIDSKMKHEVYFFNDDKCRRAIRQAYPRLLPHFEAEPRGANKADICRIAALYLLGGYYFDSDLEIIEPYLLPPEVSFSTVTGPLGPKYMFQAYIAAAPKHPILLSALRYMELHYDGTMTQFVGDIVGPYTLQWAFDSVSEEERGEVVLLKEILLNVPYWQRVYPSFPRQRGDGLLCNYAVHHPKELKIYFYSRAVDYSDKCTSKKPVV